jgi:hypothetical protein
VYVHVLVYVVVTHENDGTLFTRYPLPKLSVYTTRFLLDHPVNLTLNGAYHPLVLTCKLQSAPMFGVFR